MKAEDNDVLDWLQAHSAVVTKCTQKRCAELASDTLKSEVSIWQIHVAAETIGHTFPNSRTERVNQLDGAQRFKLCSLLRTNRTRIALDRISIDAFAAEMTTRLKFNITANNVRGAAKDISFPWPRFRRVVATKAVERLAPSGAVLAELVTWAKECGFEPRKVK